MPANKANENLQVVVGQRLADRFPGDNVTIQNFHPQLGNCVATVTDIHKKLIATFVVHFDPKGVIAAIDPPPQPRCNCEG